MRGWKYDEKSTRFVYFESGGFLSSSSSFGFDLIFKGCISTWMERRFTVIFDQNPFLLSSRFPIFGGVKFEKWEQE